MFARFAALVCVAALFACAPAERESETPAFRLVQRLGAVEIRQYGGRIAVETKVAGDEIEARTTGFLQLTGYFTHANAELTVPLGQAQDEAGHWRVRLFLPAGRSLTSLPKPDSKDLTLVLSPAETLAVLTFHGTPAPAAVAGRTGELVAALEGSAWRPAGAPVAWFYDLPGTNPPVRHNEVAIPVSPN